MLISLLSRAVSHSAPNMIEPTAALSEQSLIIKGAQSGISKRSDIAVPLLAKVIIAPWLYGDRAIVATIIISKIAKVLPIKCRVFAPSLSPKIGFARSQVIIEDAVKSWESIVDMPAANVAITTRGNPQGIN